MKHRLFVLTDISSLEAEVREPDDGQSLIRLLFYSNEIDIEGLCATSNLGHGQICRPELIERAVAAYESDWPRLHARDAAFPTAAQLQLKIRGGQSVAGPNVALSDSMGVFKDTPASDFLIEVVDQIDENQSDQRPLWVAVWGGTADLAQALLRVRESRTRQQVENFVSRLKIHAVYDQDSTAQWIKSEFPDLFYITRTHGIRGMYRGGDTSLVSAQWVEENVINCGALGQLYPNYAGFDPWGEVSGVKEGDTPSFLNLVGGGDPLSGWGGTFAESAPQRWEDAPAQNDQPNYDFDPRLSAIYRHRAAFQADFARRLSWCRA